MRFCDKGKWYRNDRLDINSTEISGYKVGWILEGEWQEHVDLHECPRATADSGTIYHEACNGHIWLELDQVHHCRANTGEHRIMNCDFHQLEEVQGTGMTSG
jgi:hypothetical protein